MKIIVVLPIPFKIIVKFLAKMIKQSMRFHALDCFISFCWLTDDIWCYENEQRNICFRLAELLPKPTWISLVQPKAIIISYFICSIQGDELQVDIDWSDKCCDVVIPDTESD